ANDGISMIQTAEGALTEVTNMLQRMRELAVQSANDTNTSSDRFALDLEYQQLGKEISRIATNTQWNAMNILNNTEVGQAGTAHDVGEGIRNVKFQVGANPNQVISIGLKDFSYNLGIDATQSESKFSLNNMSGMQDFQFKLDGQTINFSTSRKIGYNDSGEALLDNLGNPVTVMTEDELVDFTTQMKKAITDTEGFSNVSVTRVGHDIYVSDAEGRAIGSLSAADPVGVSAISNWTAATGGSSTTFALDNMAGKKDFSLNVNGQAIDFSIATAVAGNTTTAAESGSIATALQTALDAQFAAGTYTVTGDTAGALTITAAALSFGYNEMYTDGNGNSIVKAGTPIVNGPVVYADAVAAKTAADATAALTDATQLGLVAADYASAYTAVTAGSVTTLAELKTAFATAAEDSLITTANATTVAGLTGTLEEAQAVVLGFKTTTAAAATAATAADTAASTAATAVTNATANKSKTIVTFDPAAIYNADNNTLVSDSFRMNVGGQWMDLSIDPELVLDDTTNIASIQAAFKDGIQSALDSVHGSNNLKVTNSGWEFTITSQIHFNTADLTGDTGAGWC
ncbi:MAG: hypothetical protein RLZ63_622, partial [Pseudomonadota bacterium]